MQIRFRRVPSVLSSSLVLLLLAFGSTASQGAEKTRLRVDDYQIEAELTPHIHQISAHAKVKFTALQDLNTAIFELHNGLRVTRVLDDKNQPLSAERVTQDSTIRVPLPIGLSKDASTTLTFEYEGAIETADGSAVRTPPSASQPLQLVPLYQRCQSWLSRPRMKTSSRPEPHDETSGPDCMPPPSDCQPLHGRT